MRFKEFKVLKEATAVNVYVIGDSIANGIAGAGSVSKDLTAPGRDTKWILQNLVTPFAKSNKAKDSIVILSSGAANSGTIYTEDGKLIQSENIAPVSQQIKLLKDAGADVILVGVASEKTPLQAPTIYTKSQKWSVDYKGMNDKLESIANSEGAKFLGPLENFDPNISKGDGIHPSGGGYNKLFQEGSKGSGKSTITTPTPANQFKVEVPKGNKNPEVADVQKALVALGFPLPKHGVDGIRGPETSGAIRDYQTSRKLSATGAPDQQTVDSLNKDLADKPDVLAKLKKSTEADVRTAGSAANLPPLKQDTVTTGKIGKILDFIARYESGGNYEIIQGGKTIKGLTKANISDIYQLQDAMKKKGHASNAVGRYQYIKDTLQDMTKLMGINPDNTVFDEKQQDDIAIFDLRYRCKLDQWLEGKVSDEEFLNKVSRVWAAIPDTSGKSYYDKNGIDKAGLTTQSALNTLQDIKTATA